MVDKRHITRQLQCLHSACRHVCLITAAAAVSCSCSAGMTLLHCLPEDPEGRTLIESASQCVVTAYDDVSSILILQALRVLSDRQSEGAVLAVPQLQLQSHCWAVVQVHFACCSLSKIGHAAPQLVCRRWGTHPPWPKCLGC
jgi:hypothetical protein